MEMIESDDRDCTDCGGTGYGGYDRGMEFCTCTAGGMAMAFHEAAPKDYDRWLKEHQSRVYGADPSE